MSIDRETDKEDMVPMEYYSANKEQNNAIGSDMDGPRDCHSE